MRNTRRDRLAVRLANLCLRLASEDYRRIVKAAIVIGLHQASSFEPYRNGPSGNTTAGGLRVTYRSSRRL